MGKSNEQINLNPQSNIYKKYDVQRILGTGGMGTVFLATFKNDKNKKVAIKYLNNIFNETEAKRFEDEAKLLSKVKSKYLPSFYEHHKSSSEEYYVMEYISGLTLHDHIRKHTSLSAKKARSYIMEIAEGIGELHAHGIIHRDIKSQNIIITNDQKIKILDLGISLTPESQRLTRENAVICSPYYAAPEYSIKNHKITKAVDIYALGVLLFEMLTGTYPYKSEHEHETITLHYKGTFPSARNFTDIPQALDNVILKATAKKPADRYQTVFEFKKAVSESLDSSKMFETPLKPGKAKQKKKLSNIINSNAFLITMIVIILVIILAVVLWFTIWGNN
ncbi:serine/threonine-protein kinase [Mycoplasma sp. 2704]|uniref:serine/threonine-protein kinase n=1 Tax=unclassified Mycoplasma TaxID=2683645 RepID=UPI002B1D603C|nr:MULTISPECIES: serine/threonine-protein kinase [unclassified Mycoplasma]MEA4134721.1 serine/threonine-protein kinase [Mycoplasma sp. 2704]MEA4333875.1 serine/threonine-protein kinase [Mycoplasma sp. 1232]